MKRPWLSAKFTKRVIRFGAPRTSLARPSRRRAALRNLQMEQPVAAFRALPDNAMNARHIPAQRPDQG